MIKAKVLNTLKDANMDFGIKDTAELDKYIIIAFTAMYNIFKESSSKIIKLNNSNNIKKADNIVKLETMDHTRSNNKRMIIEFDYEFYVIFKSLITNRKVINFNSKFGRAQIERVMNNMFCYRAIPFDLFVIELLKIFKGSIKYKERISFSFLQRTMNDLAVIHTVSIGKVKNNRLSIIFNDKWASDFTF